MTSKSLMYAETTLGVHEVYEEAVGAASALHDLFASIALHKSTRREVKEQIAQREVEIYTEEGSKHATMSKTALQDHVKVCRQVDVMLTALRKRLDDIENYIDSVEYDVREYEHTIKIREARMIELGGYLNYLAVTKQASLQVEQTIAKDASK